MSSKAVDEDGLRVLGLTLIGKPPHKGQSIKQQDRNFRAHYGASWVVVAILWGALCNVDSKVNGCRAGGGSQLKQKHLLWCLHFFKVYATEDVSSSTMSCDPCTYRKWVWGYTRDIAFLFPFYVSFC